MNIIQVPSPNFGYPRGTHNQNKPEALLWHITASRPTNPPLSGLDSHFTNPLAYASTQLGIQDEEVHQYVDFADACWGQGYMNDPDLSNPIIKNWWDNSINPNLRSIGVEAVRLPGMSQVPHGIHLVNEATWKTMKEVGRYIAEEVPSIGFVVVRWLGHWQVDGVNRQRDPKNVYWATDILEEILSEIQSRISLEGDDMWVVQAPDDHKTYRIVGMGSKIHNKDAVERNYYLDLAGQDKPLKISKVNLDRLRDDTP